MIIICKQSVNPSLDAAGAVRAAQSFLKTASPRVVGYRYLEDPSLTKEQRRALEDSEDTRRMFNVLTDPEIVTVLQNSLSSLPASVQVVFRDQRCVDCGEAGDRRLLSQYCHLEKCRKHPGRLQRVHPGGVELYHTASELISLHPGHLRSPWYLCAVPGVARKWDCCKVIFDDIFHLSFILFRKVRRQRAADLSMFAAEERKVVRRDTPAARGRQTLAEAALAVNSFTAAADWDLSWRAVR